VVEVNARLGGARIDQIVKAVWGVDLIEAQLRSALGLPQTLAPSRKPRCAVVNALVHAPRTGRLESLPFRDVEPEGELGVELDIDAKAGDEVAGPEEIFASVLAELTLSGRDLRRAQALAEEVLRDPPVVAPAP
jgi:biotin carboxylase